MTKKLRFGLIGCGRIAGKHIKAIEECLDAKLIAVCDIDFDKAVKIDEKKASRIHTYRNFQVMLHNPDVDIVDICTPNHLHKEMCIAAAKAGKHVLVEKPMALTVEDAEEMIEVCKENDVRLFVVKQNRFNPPIRLLKEAIANGRFGKFVMAEARVLWSRPHSYYDDSEWHGQLKKDGGMLFTQASHHIDMLQWLMGDVVSVQAQIATRTHDIETEDTASIILKFENGALGIVVATNSVFPRNLEGSITILGENGTVVIGGTAMDRISNWSFLKPNEMDVPISNLMPSTDIYGEGHKSVIENVADSILKGEKALVTGDEGIKSIRIIEAAYKSVFYGEEVLL